MQVQPGRAFAQPTISRSSTALLTKARKATTAIRSLHRSSNCLLSLILHFSKAFLPLFPFTRCLSVCPSVTFVSCAKTNKDIFDIFSPCGSQAILVFPYQTGWRYSNGNPLPPNGGVECKRGMKKLTIFDQYLAVSQKRL